VNLEQPWPTSTYQLESRRCKPRQPTETARLTETSSANKPVQSCFLIAVLRLTWLYSEVDQRASHRYQGTSTLVSSQS